MLFSRIEHTKPNDSIPFVKTDLSNLNIEEDYLVWFGHSSYFIQADQTSFLIDPVLTKNASPIYGTNLAFKGADRKSTRLNSSHVRISYAVFCLKKKKN